MDKIDWQTITIEELVPIVEKRIGRKLIALEINKLTDELNSSRSSQDRYLPLVLTKYIREPESVESRMERFIERFITNEEIQEQLNLDIAYLECRIHFKLPKRVKNKLYRCYICKKEYIEGEDDYDNYLSELNFYHIHDSLIKDKSLDLKYYEETRATLKLIDGCLYYVLGGGQFQNTISIGQYHTERLFEVISLKELYKKLKHNLYLDFWDKEEKKEYFDFEKYLIEKGIEYERGGFIKDPIPNEWRFKGFIEIMKSHRNSVSKVMQKVDECYKLTEEEKEQFIREYLISKPEPEGDSTVIYMTSDMPSWVLDLSKKMITDIDTRYKIKRMNKYYKQKYAEYDKQFKKIQERK